MVKIMVVDDNSEFRTILRKFIEGEGYEVIESESGEKCLKKLEKGERPDLILLDIMMPEMDGWEVSRTIKSNQSFKDIPICMLTAKTSTMDSLMSLESGHANWHLNKPISKKILMETIEELLSQSEVNSLD
jgi:CheY-like chemotaxis protein